MPAPAGSTGTPTARRAAPLLLAAALVLGAAPHALAQTAPTPTPTAAQPQATTVTIGVSRAGAAYAFSGTVTPALAGVQVTIARLGEDGRVTGVASTRTTAGGRYELSTHLPAGLASYYALTTATPELQAGRSRLYGLLVNVTPGSIPTVTLDVRRGSSTYVFSGQVTPARSVPLTLARIVDGRPVGVVGTRTPAGGQYAISMPVAPGTHYFQVLAGAGSGLPAASSRVYGLVVPATAAAGRPAAVSPVQGGTYFGAYLALGSGSGDPRLAAADASARALGYVPGRTSLGCDQGAARGLGRPAASQEHATVLYFRTEAEARRFTALHAPVEAGVVRVQTFCRD